MSGRKRFFVDNINYPESREAVLDGEEFIHAKTVQRVDIGSEIVLLDGSGREYTAVVSKIEKRSLIANIIGEAFGDKEPKTQIYLICGALKGDKTELVVQKACELGAYKIGVFSSEFCSAYINANKLERLNKVSREAAKQCLRSCAPEVVYFDKFTEALKSAEGFENKLFACEFAEKSEIDITKISGSIAILIGSEGGFSEREAKEAESSGFSKISLGKRILRAETAAISLTAIVSCALGELK